MSFDVVKDWTTKAGLRAVILFVRGSHHCGYVAVEEGNPLHGKGYDVPIAGLSLSDDEPVGKRGYIPLMLHALSDDGGGMRMDVFFNVHGGVTYTQGSRDYPVKADGLWWIGFDCAHAGDATGSGFNHDGDVFRDAEYVEAECESLAQQIVDATEQIKEAA